jgi:outer membrane protein OmpA-like peptidoglycan-associated protein
LPTGDRALFAGDGGVRVNPHLLAAGEVGVLAYAASVGFMVHAQDQAFAGNPLGDELVLGGAIGIRTADRHLLIGPEIYGRTDATDSGTFFARHQSPLEGLLGVHVTAGDWRVGAGAGPGLTQGFGSPRVRVVGAIEWAPGIAEPMPAPLDRDGDGIPDAQDACPDEAGERTDDPQTNGCPPRHAADRDKDGIPDDDDACPDVPGVKTDDPKTNGCPADRDHDGVPDADDACPDVPGVKTSDPKTNGCPPSDTDRDKDGIPNDQDACPDTPGEPNPDPRKNGCPKAAVQQGQIKIVDQVKFQTASAVILPESDGILGAVLKVLNDHPEIKRLSVEGHTDSRGGAAYNKGLSQQRAASVVRWLVAHGVDVTRLSSVGYGQDRPIDTNTSEEGRQNNRRVEFHIVGGP